MVPQIGEAVAELTLVSWLKHPGDMVKTGDVLFEIDSDKAIVEVEAYVDGRLIEVLAEDGSSVLPLDVVGVIETAAEADIPAASAPEPATEAPQPVPAKPIEADGKKATPVAQRIASEQGIDLTAITGTGPRGRILAEDVFRQVQPTDLSPANRRINASPKARRLAKERGVDLSLLQGTGVDGMIRVQDIEAAQSPPAATLNGAVEPLSKLRQTIAMRTLQSKHQVPHFYLMAEVNMSQAQALRSYCVSTAGWERPPTYTAILIRACALALGEMPSLNRSYTDAGLLRHEHISIGVAVDTGEGLMAPVIRDAGKLDLYATATALQDVVQRTQTGRLKPADMGERSMTISNLGMYSVDQFIAIIDQPDPMIMAVGRVADRVVALNGEVAVQPMCTLTLSVDHRVLDGAQGARFLERVKNHLEQPYAILG